MISSLVKLTFLFLLFSFATTAKAQTTRPQEFEPSGEVASAVLDDVINQSKSIDKPIILIARLGTRETLRKWNLRRLHNVATRLSGIQEIIKVEGERITGKGCVEIYFDGSLLYRFLSHNNKDLAVDCCEFPSDLYPWYKPSKNKKNAHRNLEEKLTETSPNVAYAVPDGSEYTGALMAELNHQLHSSLKPLILISHLGNDEIASSLHQHRLKTVTYGLFSEPKGGLLLTQGSKVNGLGRVDCYIDGMRALSLLTEKNESFTMSCCNLSEYDPRPARIKRKRKLRLAKEKVLNKKLH